MSYDISLCDPVTHETLEVDDTHFVAGGTRSIGGTKELWLNITYNYGMYFRRDDVLVERASALSTARQAQKASRCLKKLFLH